MANDFRSALARSQGDYDFYVLCQTDPEAALAEYVLTPDERAALTNPQRLAESLRPGGPLLRLPTITITISGSHDWVNVAAPKSPDRTTEMVAAAAEAVRRAVGAGAREESTLRLIRAIA